MLKKTITYTDFKGVERTEDFFFHFTDAELVQMQLETEGTLEAYIQRIIKAKDQPALIKIFKELVLKAYGEQSDDGRYFRKSEEMAKEFSFTQAYSDIYMELVQDDEAAVAFIAGAIPEGLAAEELANKEPAKPAELPHANPSHTGNQTI